MQQMSIQPVNVLPNSKPRFPQHNTSTQQHEHARRHICSHFNLFLLFCYIQEISAIYIGCIHIQLHYYTQTDNSVVPYKYLFGNHTRD